MAFRPRRLGAHECGLRRARALFERGEIAHELRARHVVCVTAERVDAQRGVRRVGTRITPTAETAQMHVADAGLRERVAQWRLAELRMPPRAGHGADVG